MTEYRRFRSFVSHIFLIGEIDFSLPELVQISRLAAISNVRQAHTNAVFFPSAQMKNVWYKPNILTETRTI